MTSKHIGFVAFATLIVVALWSVIGVFSQGPAGALGPAGAEATSEGLRAPAATTPAGKNVPVVGRVDFGAGAAVAGETDYPDLRLPGPLPALNVPPGQATASATGETLTKARSMIDAMADDLEQMITQTEAASTDEAKVKEIGEAFRRKAEAMKTEGEELNKQLSEDEKVQLESYGREKIAPLLGRLMGAMMRAQSAGTPQDAPPAEGDTPDSVVE